MSELTLTGNRSDYSVVLAADGSLTVSDLRAGSPDGSHTIGSGAHLQFADAAVFMPGALSIHGVPGTSVYLGYSVAVADINGDGFADVVLVAGGEGGGETRNDQPGGSYVFFGSAAGLPPNPYIANVNPAEGFTIDNVGFSRGLHVGAAGDVNGDGIPDLLVGDGHAYHNAAYVVFGKSGGFGDHFDPSTLDGSDGFKVLGGYNSGVGGAVAPAGDVNGDGYDDIIVGAPSSAGAAYVVFGKAGGFPAVLPVQSLDGSNGFRIIGNPHIHGFGTSVAAGDINGDGFSDLIVGYSVGGKADVVFGKAGGFAATVNVTALDGSNGFAINHAGANVSAADVNGDGFADVITGSGGTATVLFGHAGSFTNAIDIIANSSDTLFLYNAPNDGSPGDGDDGGGPVTDLTVTSAGDVNGDGFDDLLVGDLQATPSGPYLDSYGYSHDHFAGEAFVIYGKASGLSGMRIDLSQPLPASVGFSITGTAAQNLGAVAAAGDINGDGFSDLVIGAPGQDFTNSRSGDVFVIYGQAPDQAVHLVGTDIGQTLAGGRFDDTLSGLGGNDVLHGNGGNDSIDGGDGNDTAVYSGQQSDYSVVAEPDGTKIVTDLRAGSPDGTDTLTDVENLLFLGRPLTIKPQVHFAVNNDIFVVSSSIGTAEDFLGDGAGHFGDGAPGGIGISTGTTLHAAVGDLNGDGIPDVITAARNIDQLHVNIGTGSGAFNQGGTVNFIPYQGLWAEIGDINGDGDADAVAITSHAASPISLILGYGDGTFEDPVETGSGLSSPTMLKLADFDGNGVLDAAIVDSGAIKIATLSRGTAVTVTHTYTPGNGTNLIAVGDVNGDGKMDIVAGNSGDGTVSVLLGQGDLTFTDGGTFNSGNSPVSLILADVNGDGALDIVTGRQDFGSGQGVSVLLNDGNGNFTTHTSVISGGVAEGTAIAVGDFNNDGHADLAVADGIQGIMFTFLGNGSGTSFATGISKFIPSGVSDLEVANFDTNTPLLSIEEDTALVLSRANHNAITISDDGVGTDTVHLTVVHGRLTLGSDANLTVSGDGTGSILVSGLAADLNAALDGLTYQPGADYNGTDTLYINVTDNGTGAGSGDSRVIAIASVNDAPILHDLRSGDFVLGQGPQGIVSDVNLADDSGRLQGATVQIENVQSGDVLAVHERHNITASYDAASGTLTLSGDDTVSNYLGVLFSLTFDTTSAVRDARTVDFSISDGSLSSTASGIVNITDINTAPSGIDKTISFGEDTTYTFSTSDFAFTDANGNGLLAVVIASLPSAGTLTDDGSAVYVGQYVWADDLASGKLQFTPDADGNGNSYASFTFQVHDDGGTNFGGVDYDTTPNTITFNVTPVNDAPVLAGTGAAPATFSFGEGDAPLAVASGLTISDDSVNLVGATVQISTGFTAGDALGFTDTAYIHGSYDAATGLLTLTGTDTVANYQAALQSITFGTNSDDPTAHGTHSTRAFSWSVTDDGGEISNTAVGSFRVTGVNDAPVIGGASTEMPVISFDLVSADASGHPGNASSDQPRIAWSPDGSKIAFTSEAGNLTPEGNAFRTDALYVKDIETGAIQLISKGLDGSVQPGSLPVFFDGGSKVAFFSQIGEGIYDNDPDQPNDLGIVVSDLATGTSHHVAVKDFTGAYQRPEGLISVSQDGSTAVFWTYAALTPDDTNGDSDIYSINLNTNAVTRLGDSLYPASIVPASNGPLIITQSVVPGGIGVVLNTLTGETTRFDTDADGVPLNATGVYAVAISADGTKVAVIAEDPHGGELTYVKNLVTGTLSPVIGPSEATRYLYPIVFSPDGTKLAFYETFTGPNHDQSIQTVILRDLATGHETLIANIDGSPISPADTYAQLFSPDGSQFAFTTIANNLVPLPPNNFFLQLEIASLGYTENHAANVIAAGLTLGDADSSVMHGATVAISDVAGGDVLGFTDTANIHGSYNALHGVLTLSGDDTVAHYQDALRSVTFSSGSDNPTEGDTHQTRTITWQASDDQDAPSGTATTVFHIAAVNDAAVIGTITGIATQVIPEDALTAITGIPSDFITDDSNPATAQMVVTLGVDHGTLKVTGSGLTIDHNNTASVTVTGTQDDINAALHGGGLKYQGNLNYNGSDTLHVSVDDQGNGGTGGPLQSAQDFGFTVTAVDDGAAGTDATVTALEDTAYAFTDADFGFTDPVDGTDHLHAVKITTLPGAGTLMDDGVAVSAGDFVSVANIAAGKLTFKGAQDGNGTGYASFTFQVQDDGGTANGGIDLDQTPKTITIDVTPVNDAPTIAIAGAVAVVGGFTVQAYLLPTGVDFTPLAYLQAFETANTPVLTLNTPVVSFTGGSEHSALADPNSTPFRAPWPAPLMNSDNYFAHFTGTMTASVAGSYAFRDYSDDGVYLLIDGAQVLTNTWPGGAGSTTLSAGSHTVDLYYYQQAGGAYIELFVTPPGGTRYLMGEGFHVIEQTDLNLTGAISVADVDSGTGSETVTLSVSEGNITVASGDSGITGLSGSGTGTVTFSGTLAQLNALLGGSSTGTVIYNDPSDNPSNAVLTVTINDGGNTGTGGAHTTQTQSVIGNTGINDAPTGADHTVTTLEDTTYVFGASDFGFTDPAESNVLLAVRITTLPGAGALKDNNVAVSAGDFVSVADITSGKLKFTPAQDASGAGYASFTFQVQDDGGTANGGIDLDQTPQTITIDVTPVNDAPTVAILGPVAVVGGFTAQAYLLPAGVDGSLGQLQAFEAANTPVLNLNTPVISITSSGDHSALSDPHSIPLRTSWPAPLLGADNYFAHFTGTMTASVAGSYTFHDHSDDGMYLMVDGTQILTNTWGQGTASVTLSAGPHTVDMYYYQQGGGACIELFVTPPGGTEDLLGETPFHALEQTDLSLTGPISVADVDGGTGNETVTLAVTEGNITVAAGDSGITGLSGSGTGTVTFSGTLAQLNALLGGSSTGTVVYNDPLDTPSDTVLTVTIDDGGNTGTGGAHTTQATTIIDVTAISDAPTGADNTVTALEDTAYVFHAADFGFTDPADGTPNSLLAVKITTLPAHGVLTDNGVAVTAGQFIPVADITGGLLSFTAASNVNGTAYASFAFQVQDNGGTANGGVDLDPTANIITVNVTSINDAPSGADNTVATLEDTAYTFAAADFGFSDPGDSPANTLLAVKIDTLPSAGTLADNGVAVTAGQFIAVADIAAGKLAFAPAADANGGGYASFTFQVQDDGGTAYGGVGTDPTPKRITVDVTAVNDSPVLIVTQGGSGFTEGQSTVAVTAGVTSSDVDGATLSGATVTITNAVAGDELDALGVSSGSLFGISFSYSYDASAHIGRLTLNGTDSMAHYEALLSTVAFHSSSDNPTDYGANTGRTIAWQANDGEGDHSLSATVTTTVAVTGVDDPSIANDDAFTTDVATAIGAGLNVLADNGSGASSDPDNHLAVAKVNGASVDVGHAITLSSGALLTLNADGTFAYDPNHAFDHLHLAAPSSGAANSTTSDSFTYTLADGASAVVHITVNGIGDGSTEYDGGSGDDHITGGNNGNLFDLSQGGNDTVGGGTENDGFYFGGAFDSNDHVDGGAGSNDQLGLEGDYSAGVTLDGTAVTGIEALAMLQGFDYKVSTLDNFVAAGQTFTFWSASMGATNHVDIDGHLESNGKFKFFLGQGNDIAKGGAGDDLFYGEGGADTLTGNGGADVFAYLQVSDSHGNANGTAYDTITDFTAGIDKLDLTVAVTAVDGTVNGSLSDGNFDTDLTNSFGIGVPNQLAAGHAVIFHVTGGGLAGHDFLIVNAHGSAGYSAGNDYVFDVTGGTLAGLATSDFI